MLVVVTLGGDGLEKMYIDRSRMHQDRSLSDDFARSVDKDRNNRNTGGDCEDEGTFLERTQRIVVSARAFRENDDAVSIAYLFCGIVVRRKRSLSVLALDGNHSCRLHCRPEN